MKAIKGKDVMLEVMEAGEFVPFLCCEDMSINFTPELINKTTLSSGKGNEYKSRRLDWDISLSGISQILGDGRTIFETVKIENIFTTWTIRMTFTDAQSNTAIFLGDVVLKSASISGPQTDFSDFENAFQGSGIPVITLDASTLEDGTPAPPAPTPGDPQSDWWNVTEGATTVSGLSAVKGLSLINKMLLAVYRSGDQYDIVTTAPGNREVSFNATTGTLTFETGFYAGETVNVLFQ
jgi:hypothetical protein